jgi:hypothetical protein
MNYRITGADAKTGAERAIEIEAAAENTALASAKAAGIFPYRCEVVPEPPPTFVPIAPKQSDRQKAPDDSSAPRNDEMETQIRCPNCRSTQITANTKGFGLGKAAVGGVLLGPVGLLGGLIGSRKVKITCLKCGHSWAPGG